MKRRSTESDVSRATKPRLMTAMPDPTKDEEDETSPPSPVEKDSGAPENEDDLVDFVVLRVDELQAPATNFSWSPRLISASWQVKYTAVETLRQTIKFDPAYIQGDDAHIIDATKDLVVPSALDLRSTLARNALLCLGELIQCTPQSALLSVVIPALLYRSVTDKKFMQRVATTALDHTVRCCDPLDVLSELLPFATDKNAQLVTKAGTYVEQCLLKSLAQPWEAAQLHAWITPLANFLNCRDVHGKPAAKRCLMLLRKTFGDVAFEAAVDAQLSGITRADVLKVSTAAARSSSIVRVHPGQKKGAKLSTRSGPSLKERLQQQQQAAKATPVPKSP
ncbi:hypothetical protein SDRG_08895 [Saprolegnia diclina VS20]|uniref:TOG domain-containing protein n=1 Tax=Saprolegnia diclina (strain VS20) TaxID=1156394 RepID=T0RT02_SAPDV|nr:hypothetical protein SDRG_08895 [Saprolegnia diclina VS20]EQC33377.1 hypothetical protein SDRG_08895 [Saprolegnia diclina VS20]|eukprot:XP_008613017.1 hypothetical protein SDRG_08895 [Saprolegnia diclina VS20]